jgi:hypothetical protein
MLIEAGFCRNPVRCMCRKLWPSLGGKLMKIYVWYVKKFSMEEVILVLAGQELRGYNRKTEYVP